MRSGIKKMKDDHRVRNNRLAITGVEGIFNGLRFIPISDSNSSERVSFEIVACVGFQKNNEEYDYFSIDEIPDATEEVMQRLKKYKSPIIQFGYEREQIDTVLREKGYLNEKSTYSEKEIANEYSKSDFLTNIKFSIDPIVRRVCAKTIFNYLCWSNSAEFMLDSKFDALRNYIRYDVWDDNSALLLYLSKYYSTEYEQIENESIKLKRASEKYDCYTKYFNSVKKYIKDLKFRNMLSLMDEITVKSYTNFTRITRNELSHPSDIKMERIEVLMIFISFVRYCEIQYGFCEYFNNN